jgi:hypothetical protein
MHGVQWCLSVETTSKSSYQINPLTCRHEPPCGLCRFHSVLCMCFCATTPRLRSSELLKASKAFCSPLMLSAHLSAKIQSAISNCCASASAEGCLIQVRRLHCAPAHGLGQGFVQQRRPSLSASRCLVSSRAHHTDCKRASPGAALRPPEGCRLLPWHLGASSGHQAQLYCWRPACDPLIARGPHSVGAALLAGLDARNQRGWCVIVEDKGD